ncbi:hypothetical protein [Mycolicibacterium austroafricanum]|uniref:hypothetical protein n=1 Tax=Mycolicibacterium austroafricanum TaxID=39687 RepID=UPI001CA319B4|nr:hypothetical protein [Mycolicibacterium austroafricanum]QZT60931.1 hypothetical protein JN085_18175 [Mycolicibacterium austroafricanum]
MTTDPGRIEELRAEHAARLLAVGIAAPDPQCLYAASKRLTGRSYGYVVAVHLRVAELLDEQRTLPPTEALACLRLGLGNFVAGYGEHLDDAVDLDSLFDSLASIEALVDPIEQEGDQ